MLSVLGIQLDIAWEDKEANFAAVSRLLASYRVEPFSLIVLPELFATGFSFDVEKIAESLDGPTGNFLASLAEKYGCFVWGGIATRGPNSLGYNEAWCFDPLGKLQARYAKVHPFSFAGETQHYAAGREEVVYPLGPWRIAPSVCYDLRFPELFRRATRRGANLLVVIANWPTPRADHWAALLTARAIENQAYVVGINRTGSDPNVKYSGHSQVIDPQGRVIAELGTEPGILAAQLDIEKLENYRREFPALADMRPEFFGEE